jgi:hypothetical protein
MFSYKAQLEELKSTLDKLQHEIEIRLNVGEDPGEVCIDLRHTLKGLSKEKVFDIHTHLPASEEKFERVLAALLHDALGRHCVDIGVLNDNTQLLEALYTRCPEWDTVAWDADLARKSINSLSIAHLIRHLTLKDRVFYRVSLMASQTHDPRIDVIAEHEPHLKRIVIFGLEVIGRELPSFIKTS